MFVSHVTFTIDLQIAPEQKGDGPEKKITRLAIGVEGGFDPESAKPKYEITDHLSVVVLPAFTTIPWPNESLPEVVTNIYFYVHVRMVLVLGPGPEGGGNKTLTKSAFINSVSFFYYSFSLHLKKIVVTF